MRDVTPRITLNAIKNAYIQFPCGCASDKGLFKPCKKHKHLLLKPWKERIKHLPDPKFIRFLY